MLSKEHPDEIYLIDFGITSQFRKNDGSHIGFSDNLNNSCTLNFASRNLLNGVAATRRDDFESIGYVMVYLYKGSLPW